ncbi:hypothetical protein VNO80_26585 [Phaseolus coccineus]|uniref:Uncharacterized protein n=1 Tax=Phaseolus coccineus TaxID=3886 RepID=A0AAN9QGV2_PHACN
MKMGGAVGIQNRIDSVSSASPSQSVFVLSERFIEDEVLSKASFKEVCLNEVWEAIARCVCHIAMVLKDLGQILDEFLGEKINKLWQKLYLWVS